MRGFIEHFLVVVGLVWVTSVGRTAGLEDARTAIEQWVKTRQMIAQTQTGWTADKETLEQGIELLERELKGVEAQFTGISTNSTQVDQERVQAEESLKASQAALAQADEFAASFQKDLTALLPRLPVPLQDLLKPFLNRLPAGTGTAQFKAVERVQALVGALNELDKFNNSLAVFSEKRRNPQGTEISVQTVYIGLGAAYFVNDTGDFAGAGSPGPNGWEWMVKPELAASVQDILRIYRNEKPARFIPLPVQIR